jgi:phosphoglucomutase
MPLSLRVSTVATTPFLDQEPGTSGLRKAVPVFQQPHYLENFVQAIFDAVPELKGGTLIVGGDGRFHNDVAVSTIIAMALANSVAHIVVGQGGLLSTPAASAMIRKRKAQGGIILSASHNPGGPDGDFGIKFNGDNGGPAAPAITSAIFARTKAMTEYKIAEGLAFDLGKIGSTTLDSGQTVEIIDPVDDYVALMETLFDFDALGTLLRSGFKMRFDAMNAITGPYAKRIFEQRLGAAAGTVMNATPLPDFGGLHPDPNPVYAAELISELAGSDGIVFGAASDGDGDRNLIVGAGGQVVAPSDSVAILAANAQYAPGYAAGLKGVARSMPTSRALDRVAKALNLPFYETPTGWKFFGSLLDAGMISICGEESAGTGSNHIREKDGVWAVLLWLQIVAARKQSVVEIVADHWKRFGRDYYQRHDHEDIDSKAAADLMTALRAKLATLPGKSLAGMTVASADDFAYIDPVDGSVTERQGIRVQFENDARIVFRLSGTGTKGATIRIYLERFEADPNRHALDPAEVLAPLVKAAAEVSELEQRTGRTKPTVIA